MSMGINPNETRAKIFYFNDLHSNIAGAKSLKLASDKFDSTIKSQPNVDTFKLCGGDSYIGRNKSNFMGRFLNSLNLDGMVLGNHEFDMGTKQLSSFVNENKFPIFTANLDYKNNNNLDDDLKSNRLIKSSIVEKNGHKYGIIGATAADIPDTISMDSKEDCTDIGFMNFEQSVSAVQQEIDKLKRQGINKIILLSHLGVDKDKKLATMTDGIDVIIGGHSHHKLPGVIPNENYFKSSAGNPVLIVQAGQNGENYGTIDVIFDEKGNIKAASNSLTSTGKNKSLIVNYLEKISYGKIEELGELTETLPIMKSGFEQHILSCFVADAIRVKSGAQIAFHNKASHKTALNAGKITNRDVNTSLPYINSVSTYKLSEKDIIDALKTSLQAPTDKPDKIGNLQVSGLKYTISKDKTLKDVYFLNGNEEVKIDVDNPSKDKFYTVVYGSFLAGGPERLKMLKAPEKRIQKFDWSDFEATVEYFKSKAVNGKINIKADGRIKVEN